MEKQIRSLLRKHGIRLRKRWGQNFLKDKEVLEKIIQGAELSKNDLVLEIGAGTGVLTEKLAESAFKVIAVEWDKKLCGILRERLASFDNVVIVQDDILKVDLRETLPVFNCRPPDSCSIRVVGNLPYYITTPIVFHLLKQKSLFNLFVIMVQREVAERMAAVPGSKDYGVLTLACRYHAEVEIIAQVGRESFFPSPGVDSALVRMKVLKEPRVKVEDEKALFSLIKSSFGQRRKTLENALLSGRYLGLKREELRRTLEEAGIEGRRRGETLSLEEFARLSNVLNYLRNKAQSDKGTQAQSENRKE
ncbi:MAG: 16S rRNA (adenine(1518)-N(6)/adenine(1519)-N(6))-dimethyltransferase RsmA [Nitrospirae bacterium]|nr:16S rRNA (adenine(1518)-N(6)/adenine(1519)-N(6))-dimethyltransferase RsmA [Nitrospirota bacterium]